MNEFSTYEITINIRRIWKYYVLHLIIPVLLILSLSLITYMIPVELIDVRIGLGLSLFLSLTALQVSPLSPKCFLPSFVRSFGFSSTGPLLTHSFLTHSSPILDHRD